MPTPPPEPPSSEITPESTWRRRREFLRDAGLFVVTSAAVGGGLTWLMGGGRADPPEATSEEPTDVPGPVTGAPAGPFDVDEPPTPFRDVTTYNNFYEFGTAKSDPARYAGTLRPRPWTVRIDGEVASPQVVGIEDLERWFTLGGARLSHALRRGVVDGHSLARVSARSPAGTRAADRERAITSRSRPSRIRCRCRDSAAVSCRGRTSRGSGWTRPCIR